jgi:hypothetical protein
MAQIHDIFLDRSSRRVHGGYSNEGVPYMWCTEAGESSLALIDSHAGETITSNHFFLFLYPFSSLKAISMIIMLVTFGGAVWPGFALVKVVL